MTNNRRVEATPLDILFAVVAWVGTLMLAVWCFVDLARDVGKAQAIETYAKNTYECKAQLVVKHPKKEGK